MFDKLEALEDRYQELEGLISNPEIISRQEEWRSYTREHSRLEETVSAYREYKKVSRERQDTLEMQKEKMDPEMALLVKEELALLNRRQKELEEEMKVLLLPRDPNDEKNVIMEIRAGAGGEEAALFAGDLFRMYSRYAERNHWKVEILSTSPTDIGGFKEIIFLLEGGGVYSRLKFESGVHRVQRVPVTESGGRIHTSTITVAVLPEAEEVEVEVNPQELRVDTFCATGPGGQSVNTTQSAVRITHLPTGIVVSCQDEKSQHKNRDKAMRVLRARLLDKMQQEQDAEVAQARRSQVGTGDRSERIRTYNYPQGRVTDHRINLTLYKLDMVLDGEIQEFLDHLSATRQAQLLSNVSG